MKRKMVKALLGASVAAMMLTGGSAAVLAEAEGTETVTEQAEEETEAVVIEDVVIPVESGEVTVKNETEKNYTVTYEKIERTAEEGEEEKEEKVKVLILTDEEKENFIFEGVKPEEWKEATLVEELGVLYIYYKDADGKEQEAAETCEERELEEKVTVYTTTNVNIREDGDPEAKVIKVSTFGEEYQAVAALTGWVKVELQDGKFGFISHKYVTADKEKLEQLKKEAEEAAAKAKAAAEAAWEAEQQQNQNQNQYQETTSSESQTPAEPETPQEPEAPAEPEVPAVYEVSREKFDDCDGSGHGYYEITYSDGSVAIEEY